MATDPDGMQEIERADVQSVRRTMRKLGVVVAEVDSDLRYVWIDNPHPDFDAKAVIGKRDDELIDRGDAEELIDLKRHVLKSEQATSRLLTFKRSDGSRRYNVSAYPVRNARGKVDGVLTFGFEADERGKR
jgi:hypothetical protein